MKRSKSARTRKAAGGWSNRKPANKKSVSRKTGGFLVGPARLGRGSRRPPPPRAGHRPPGPPPRRLPPPRPGHRLAVPPPDRVGGTSLRRSRLDAGQIFGLLR